MTEVKKLSTVDWGLSELEIKKQNIILDVLEYGCL